MLSSTKLPAWQHVWRHGFAPELDIRQLLILRHGLRADDNRLLQGATTMPPPLMCVRDWPCEAGCALCYTAWQSDLAGTVGKVEEAFAAWCFAADQRLGEPAACRYFLNWFDDSPRHEVFAALATEIEYNLTMRGYDYEEYDSTNIMLAHPAPDTVATVWGKLPVGGYQPPAQVAVEYDEVPF